MDTSDLEALCDPGVSLIKTSPGNNNNNNNAVNHNHQGGHPAEGAVINSPAPTGDSNPITATPQFLASQTTPEMNTTGSNANGARNTNNGNTATSAQQNSSGQGGGNNVKSCAGCGARIHDRFLLHALDRYWHTGCLKCSCCQAHLGEIGTSCFTKAGMILCKNDYIRLFGSSGTCSACAQSIPASEFVMKAQTNVYHLNCFTCVMCHNRLVPGDRYSLVNGGLVCEHDYPKVIKGHTPLPIRASHKVC